jgi:hypothetical protein
MFALVHSLAAHMCWSLGSWSAPIGTRGFSTALKPHADTASGLLALMVLTIMPALPVSLLVGASVRALRPALVYLGLHALKLSICFLAMLLAPTRFVAW